MKTKAGSAPETLLKLSDIFSPLSVGENKHEPLESGNPKHKAIGVIQNPVTRRMFSLAEEIRQTAQGVIGGPVEKIEELLDLMSGPDRRAAEAKLIDITTKAELLQNLFWALVREEITVPEDVACISVRKGWEVTTISHEETLTESGTSIFASTLLASLLGGAGRRRPFA